VRRDYRADDLVLLLRGGVYEDDVSYQADLDIDFANEDQTGLVWTWLDHARDDSVVVPGAVLILRDGEDFAMGQVADLAKPWRRRGRPRRFRARSTPPSLTSSPEDCWTPPRSSTWPIWPSTCCPRNV
jgi:hypothetical protein